MRVGIRGGIAVVIMALTLLGLAGRTAAGPLAACCVCRCQNVFACAVISSPEDCRSFCAGQFLMNGTACEGEIVASPCGAVPECPEPTGAPALGEGGLTAVALFLAGLGVFGLRRAARRTRV